MKGNPGRKPGRGNKKKRVKQKINFKWNKLKHTTRTTEERF